MSDNPKSEMSPNAAAFTVENIIKGSPTFYSNTSQMSQLLTNQKAQTEVEMKLNDYDLWAKFHSIGNEMIVNKIGRRTFPLLSVDVRGLEPRSMYKIWIEILPVDNHTYKYDCLKCEWVKSGEAENSILNTVYVHPESPSIGHYWMSQAIVFNKLKLTNSKEQDIKNQIRLQSMRKYQPQIHVQKVFLGDRNELENDGDPFTFIFPETQFITLTSYQSYKITQLKTANNPYAKGNRDLKQKRKEEDLEYIPNGYTSSFSKYIKRDIDDDEGSNVADNSTFPSNTDSLSSTSSTSTFPERIIQDSYSLYSSPPVYSWTPNEPIYYSSNYNTYNTYLPQNNENYFSSMLPTSYRRYPASVIGTYNEPPSYFETCLNNLSNIHSFGDTFYYNY